MMKYFTCLNKEIYFITNNLHSYYLCFWF